MSGAEVAGLVLGALPLLISALEHYKSGVGSVAAMLKWRGLLDTLIFRLKTQRTLFYLNVMILLRAAGFDDMELQKESDCYKKLLEGDTSKKLKEYLDFTYDTFEQTVLRYEKCIKLLVKKLSNIKRLPKVSVMGPGGFSSRPRC